MDADTLIKQRSSPTMMLLSGLLFLMAVAPALFSCTLPLDPGYVKKNADPPDEVVFQHSKEINRLYDKIKIRSLLEISESEYPEYKQYVSGNTINVIVHPAYFVFFHDYNDNKVAIPRNDDFSKNIVDLFIENYPADDNRMLQQMKLNLNVESQFLKEKSLQHDLVVLVIPPRYRLHPEYPYKKLDEFGRYLNEVTKGSPSVLYVESENFKQGSISRATFAKLSKFFNALNIRTVRIGGEYKGLCVNNFYNDMLRVKTLQRIVLIPELCTSSPDSFNF